MLQAGVVKPVTEATQSGNLKLHICLDPKNLNKAIIHDPYHFKMSDDIAHLIVDACIMTVCDCQKAY